MGMLAYCVCCLREHGWMCAQVFLPPGTTPNKAAAPAWQLRPVETSLTRLNPHADLSLIPQNPSTPNTVLKDLDLRQRFKLDAAAARALHDQLDADTRLLSSLRVMDYSMLVGVHQPTAGGAVGAVDGSKSAAAGVPQQMQQQQRNFAEHSTAAGKCTEYGTAGALTELGACLCAFRLCGQQRQ